MCHYLQFSLHMNVCFESIPLGSYELSKYRFWLFHRDTQNHDRSALGRFQPVTMNSEHNKINHLKATPFDKLRANGINQSFLRLNGFISTWAGIQERCPLASPFNAPDLSPLHRIKSNPPARQKEEQSSG